jgi:citrate lyase subunit beta/citryl-CoA lyase
MIRSALMVAGDKPQHLEKLSSLQCDIAIVNLEDGVASKNKARELVKKTLVNLKEKKAKIIVRVNDLNTCGLEDIEALKDIEQIDGFRIPKVKTQNDVQLALSHTKKEIHLSIETKEAFENLTSLRIDNHVTTVYLGILDLLESLELPQSLINLDNPTIDYILSKFLIDAKTVGFTPISFVYQDYKDLDTFTKWCEKEKQIGLKAKGCVSPDQVKIANKIFDKDELQIKKAQEIKELFEKNRGNGVTGFSHEKYGFIDEPIYKDALLVLKGL